MVRAPPLAPDEEENTFLALPAARMLRFEFCKVWRVPWNQGYFSITTTWVLLVLSKKRFVSKNTETAELRFSAEDGKAARVSPRPIISLSAERNNKHVDVWCVGVFSLCLGRGKFQTPGGGRARPRALGVE